MKISIENENEISINHMETEPERLWIYVFILEWSYKVTNGPYEIFMKSLYDSHMRFR